SPTLTCATTPLASTTVTGPVAVWILPIAWGGGAPIIWAQPPIAPSSPGASQVSRNTRPLPVLWGAYPSETRFLSILFLIVERIEPKSIVEQGIALSYRLRPS